MPWDAPAALAEFGVDENDDYLEADYINEGDDNDGGGEDLGGGEEALKGLPNAPEPQVQAYLLAT